MWLMPQWQRKLSRLTQMNWEEMRTRLSQEVWKRVDLAMYRAGLEEGSPRLTPDPCTETRFFFASNEGQHRATLLCRHLPREADAIIQEADEICRHEFRLLGYEKLRYGPEIDWHFAQGKRTDPLTPWFKINFLDFHTVGDHKVVWELNRHQHFVTLAKAWLLTGNDACVNELLAQWYSWQRANPYPLGINWASALEVAFRSLSWLWARSLLGECSVLPTNFQKDLLSALALNGRYIERFMSTYFSPNTHLLGEAVALFFVGTLCPQILASERWRKLGWSVVLRESERQVRPDGVYFEQALYYHVYALDFFLHARILASKNGIEVPERFDDVVKKMLDVIEALSAVGSIEGFGDDDGGRVFNPPRNRVECMTDPLAVGAVLYSHNYTRANLTEESIWLFGDKAIQQFETPRSQLHANSSVFPSGGIYLINDLEPRPQQLTIDAGPQGTGHSGHGHADALSIRFSVGAQRFLIDPGTYCYVSAGEERNCFRGTGAHNTLRVDTLDQAVPEGPFAWSLIPRTTAETWLNGESFDFFVGSHDGYSRLPEPVLHRRFIFHVKGGFWFVRDVAEGQGTHLLESFWHFAPDISIEAENDIVVAKPADDHGQGQNLFLTLLTDRNSVWTAEVTEGFVSPAYGLRQVAPVLRISARASLPQDCRVLLVPATSETEIGTLARLGESSFQEVSSYRYQTARATEFLFLNEGKQPWTCGPCTSDSKLLYCKLAGDRFTHVIMASGTFADWQGERFVLSRSEVFEWQRNGKLKKASSAEANVLEDFVVTKSDALNSVR